MTTTIITIINDGTVHIDDGGNTGTGSDTGKPAMSDGDGRSRWPEEGETEAEGARPEEGE